APKIFAARKRTEHHAVVVPERRSGPLAAEPTAYAPKVTRERVMSGFLWIILVGFVAGIIARVLSPGPNNPGGFILTTVLGIVGAFLATFIGQTIGWYRADQGAGFIAATIGALIVLFIWNRLVVHGAIRDQGVPGSRL